MPRSTIRCPGPAIPRNANTSSFQVAPNLTRTKFLLFLSGLLLILFAWATATPMFAVPDEISHFVTALGATNFQFDSRVDLNGFYDWGFDCFAFQNEVPASCYEVSWNSSITTMPVTTSGYLPTFFLIVSLPLHFSTGLNSFIVARTWIAIINFSVLAIGFHYFFQSRLNRSSALIILLVLSPFPLYFMASINPSGLAYSLTFLLAVFILKSLSEPVPQNWKWVITFLTLAFLTVRRDSIVWVGVIGVAIVSFSQVRSFVQDLLKPNGQLKSALLKTIPLVLAGLTVAYITSQYARAFLRNGEGVDLTQIRVGVGNIYPVFLQLLGKYGWLSEDLPDEIYALFTSILIVIFAFVTIVGSEPFRRTFLKIICSAFCLLVFGSVLRPGYLQGRYFFPAFAFGVVCASYALAYRSGQLSKQASTTLFGLVTAGLSILHLVSFFEVAKRFSDGSSTSFPNAISSPIGLLQLPIFAYLIVYALGLFLIFYSLREFSNSPSQNNEVLVALPSESNQDEP